MGARFELFTENERIGYVLRAAAGAVIVRRAGSQAAGAAREADAALQGAAPGASTPAGGDRDAHARRSAIADIARKAGALARRHGAEALDHGAILYDEDGLPR